MTRTLSMLAGIRRLAVAGAAAVLLLVVLPGGVAQAAGSVTNTTAPAISGTAQSGQILTADPGSWSGDTSGGFSYQWQRCDTHGASCNPIAGATSSTYTAQEFGITLVVAVTALDGPTVATSGRRDMHAHPELRRCRLDGVHRQLSELVRLRLGHWLGPSKHLLGPVVGMRRQRRQLHLGEYERPDH